MVGDAAHCVPHVGNSNFIQPIYCVQKNKYAQREITLPDKRDAVSSVPYRDEDRTLVQLSTVMKAGIGIKNFF